MTLTVLALSLSTLALVASTFALFAARRSSDRSLSKRCNELSAQLSDLAETLERQSLAVRNLRSRANMQIARERKANGDASTDPGTREIDPEAEKDRWTREMNLKLATGQVIPPTRRK